MVIYQPTPVPQEARNLSSWLQNEMRRIAEAGNQGVNSVQLNPMPVAPGKPRDGLTAYADGTNWNPGSGAGVYTYRGGAWRFLG